MSEYLSLGDLSAVEPPDSIPNSEVKRRSADDSMGATLCENTSSPRLRYSVFFGFKIEKCFVGHVFQHEGWPTF